MRKKGKNIDDAVKEHEKINIKLIELRDNVLEEFDMLELVEDSIKDIFSCDLNCVTCSNNERGKCMQDFKKANLYWIRKIAQDELYLKQIVEQMDEMRILLQDAIKYAREMETKRSNVDYKDRAKEKKKELKNYGYYS